MSVLYLDFIHDQGNVAHRLGLDNNVRGAEYNTLVESPDVQFVQVKYSWYRAHLL